MRGRRSGIAALWSWRWVGLSALAIVLALPQSRADASTHTTLAIAAGGSLQPAAQDEFVPIDQLPPEDTLPAAPLLIAAYGFVWVAMMAYLWSIWRRVGRVERELGEVERRLRKSSGQ